MSFMLDEQYGLKDIQEFGECESKKTEWTNKVISEFVNNYKPFSRQRSVSRAEKEWVYCLLYEYKSCNMNVDFHNIVKSLCNFYFDGIFRSKFNTPANTSNDSNSNDSHKNQFTTENTSTTTTNTNISASISMNRNHNKNKTTYTGIQKKQDPPNNTMNNLKNIQHRDQYYIISTINLLLGLDNSNLNNSDTPFFENTIDSKNRSIVLPTIYHTFFILVILGKEVQVQKSVRKVQIEKCPTDTPEGKCLLNKLNNLIKYCSKHSETLIQQPYNVHNSQIIIENYVLNAILVYENMIDLDSS